MSLSAKPQERKSETVIEIYMYQSVNGDQVEDAEIRVQNVLPGACPEHEPKFPVYGHLLLGQRRPVSKTENLFTNLASLLTVYQLVFCQTENMVRQKDVIEHSILILDGIKHIQLPQRRQRF